MSQTDLPKKVLIEEDLSLAPLMTFKESKNLPIHRWFWYKEGFSPQLLERFNINKTVFDPFCGVGTSLLYAKECNIESYGIDASPLATFVSRTKTRNYNKKTIENLKKALSIKFDTPSIKWDFELFSPRAAFPKRNYNQLLYLREVLESYEERDLLLLALLSILPQVSLIKKDGGVLKIDSRKRAVPTKVAFKRKIKQIIQDIQNSKQGPEPQVSLGDARTYNQKADVIFTSPPYLNNVDYSKVYGLELSLLTLDKQSTLNFRSNALRSFITRTSKVSGFEEYAHLPIVTEYLSDMKRFVETSYKNLEQEGHLYIVVANGVIQNTHIPVDELLARFGLDLFDEVKIIVGAYRVADVKPKKISVRESVVVMKKC